MKGRYAGRRRKLEKARDKSERRKRLGPGYKEVKPTANAPVVIGAWGGPDAVLCPAVHSPSFQPRCERVPATTRNQVSFERDAVGQVASAIVEGRGSLSTEVTLERDPQGEVTGAVMRRVGIKKRVEIERDSLGQIVAFVQYES